MKICDTCHGSIEPGHPFTVCPKCLFADALCAPVPAESPVAPAGTNASPVLAGLYRHRDFFEKYEILERLDEGGQGEVFKAWDFDLRRYVAMKRLAVVFLSSEPAIYRFLAEAQIASQLEHPGILPIHDVGIDPDGRPFFTTPVLPHMTVSDVIRRVREGAQAEWTLDRALALLGRVCEIAGYAHSRGVIHRDLKPPNILVGRFGDVRVIDWGSAHVLREARASFEEAFVRFRERSVETDRSEVIRRALNSPLATHNSGQALTLQFAAPEILRGELQHLGPATDIYSVGVMLYDVVAGRLPYSDANEGVPIDRDQLKERILSEAPEPVRSARHGVSRDLAAICEKAMARSPSERYASMKELEDDLRAFLETRPVRARPPYLALKVQKWAQRNGLQVAFGSIALTLILAGLFIALHFKGARDLAAQSDFLRQAELATRVGQWREVVRHLRAAEAAGYPNKIDLALQRLEAWTALGETTQARAELNWLTNRSDLGPFQSTVLLKLGEFELFEEPTVKRGIQHVREAIAHGLKPGDERFARALVADSTLVAMTNLQEALRLDPFHFGAHRLRLMLDFSLGRERDFHEHSRIFRLLFPDDSSPAFFEATYLALNGQIEAALKHLEPHRASVNAQNRNLLPMSLRLLANVSPFFDVDMVVGERAVDTKFEDIMADLFPLFFQGQVPNPFRFRSDVRRPQLPCLKSGLEESMEALGSLAFAGSSDTNAALEKIKAGWQRHPEGLFPLFAATFLEAQHPTNAPKPVLLLTRQADLYQLAAGSPSCVPKLPRLARYFAAQTLFDLSRQDRINAANHRQTCLQYARDALSDPKMSVGECRKYFDFSIELADFHLARAILSRWEAQEPSSRRVVERRIDLDIATGALGSALQQLDQLLSRDPADAWASARRAAALKHLGKVAESARAFPEARQ